MGLEGPGLILIIIVALIAFGPKKLPELGRAFGKTIREFKNATSGLLDDESPKGTEPKFSNVSSDQPPALNSQTTTVSSQPVTQSPTTANTPSQAITSTESATSTSKVTKPEQEVKN